MLLVPTAGTDIGSGTDIGPGTDIGSGTDINSGTDIGPGTDISSGTDIGSGTLALARMLCCGDPKHSQLTQCNFGIRPQLRHF